MSSLCFLAMAPKKRGAAAATADIASYFGPKKVTTTEPEFDESPKPSRKRKQDSVKPAAVKSKAKKPELGEHEKPEDSGAEPPKARIRIRAKTTPERVKKTSQAFEQEGLLHDHEKNKENIQQNATKHDRDDDDKSVHDGDPVSQHSSSDHTLVKVKLDQSVTAVNGLADGADAGATVPTSQPPLSENTQKLGTTIEDPKILGLEPLVEQFEPFEPVTVADSVEPEHEPELKEQETVSVLDSARAPAGVAEAFHLEDVVSHLSIIQPTAISNGRDFDQSAAHEDDNDNDHDVSCTGTHQATRTSAGLTQEQRRHILSRMFKWPFLAVMTLYKFSVHPLRGKARSCKHSLVTVLSDVRSQVHRSLPSFFDKYEAGEKPQPDPDPDVQQQQRNFFTDLKSKIEGMTISTCFSGVDTPCSSYMGLSWAVCKEAGFSLDQMPLPRNLFAIEKFSKSREELFNHPHEAEHIFEDVTSFWTPHVQAQLRRREPTEEFIETVLIPAVLSGNAATDSAYCLKHKRVCKVG